MFFHGEDAVADDLAPFIDAAPREEQKYFLVHPAGRRGPPRDLLQALHERGRRARRRHRSRAALQAVEPELTWGFRKTFALLDEITGALRDATARAVALARAVTMYHVVVEALLAQPGQHFISDYLEQRELLPGFREGMRQVALDEQRHIGFGVKLLHDLRAEEPGVRRRRRGPDPPRHAVLARGLHPAELGPLLHRVLRLHAGGDLHRGRALLRAEAALGRAAAGVAPRPVGLSARDDPARARGVRPGDAAGRLHRPAERRAAARSGVAGAADDLGRARRSTPAPRPPARSPSSGSSPTPSRGTCASTTARPPRAPGRAPRVDLELRCRYEDFVDVVAGRLDPRRAVATRKLRPHGSPRALWAARTLFG